MKNVLQDGYYKVTRAANGELKVRLAGANHEPLAHTETFTGGWPSVLTNVAAQLRAAHGRYAIIVDATGQNATGDKLYYRMLPDGSLRQLAVSDTPDDSIPGEETTEADAETPEETFIEGKGGQV